MKAELKVKFLQHLNQKKTDEGFTLIELLVVIIIIGILSAIALPSFLNQAAKAKQSEAKTYIGSMNRAQQAYRIQNPQFASNGTALEIGLPSDTVNYSYTITSGDYVTSAYAQANAKDAKSLKSFAGGVIIKDNGQTEAKACQTTGVTSAAINPALTTNSAATCPANTTDMQ